MDNRKRNILNSYLTANASEEWKLLNRVHKIIDNKQQENNKEDNRELLDALALCSLEFINIELSTDKKKTY